MRKILFKTLLYFSILNYLGGILFASVTNFDYSIKENLVSENIETKVTFNYSLLGYEEADFIIKPLISSGIVEIYNPEYGEWVGSYSYKNNFPTLSKNMVIRFQSLMVERTYLWFEIANLKNGLIYFTPKKIVWGEKIYDGYVENVNYSIVNAAASVKESSGEVLEVTEIKTNYKNKYMEYLENLPKSFYLYVCGVLFILSTIISFVYLKVRGKKEMIQSISEDFKKLDTGNTVNGSYLHTFFSSWRCGK